MAGNDEEKLPSSALFCLYRIFSIRRDDEILSGYLRRALPPQGCANSSGFFSAALQDTGATSAQQSLSNLWLGEIGAASGVDSQAVLRDVSALTSVDSRNVSMDSDADDDEFEVDPVKRAVLRRQRERKRIHDARVAGDTGCCTTWSRL